MALRDLIERKRAAKQPTLAELRQRKQEQKAKTNGLAALRKRKQEQKLQQPKQMKRSKHDFYINGVGFHNVQQINGYWTIDISNGDKSYTMHNRCGSWLHDIHGAEGRMAEPARVALALGVAMSQMEVSQALTERLEREFQERGIPTRDQRRRMREKDAKKS